MNPPGIPPVADATLDLQPTLNGSKVRLRPLRAEDFDPLHAAASDPAIWAQHPDPARYQKDVFRRRYFAGALASGSAFVVIDTATAAIVGSTRYYDLNPVRRDLAIGYTFLARACWGRGANAEMKRLLLDHAFGWAETVWFHVGEHNRRSRRAVEKLGAEYVRMAPFELAGVTHNHACYRIRAAAWV